jgi:hypothetical protein
MPGIYDTAYGGGTLTLSPLSAEGMAETFCGSCYLGIITAGDGSGYHSKEQEYLLKHVMINSLMTSELNADFCSARQHQKCAFITQKPDRTKQEAVPDILEWYASKGIEIAPKNVYFFGDRKENIPPFAGTGYNAKVISCNSRDHSHGNMIGYCGARPEEIVPTSGAVPCPSPPR